MNILEVQALCSEGKIIWTEHVEKRMAQRNISKLVLVREFLKS